MICPAEEHMAELLGFVERWDRRSPWSCIASRDQPVHRRGVLGFLRRCGPIWTKRRLPARLRSRSPEATPNARLVALADALLGREGRMISAVQAIGRGADAYEGSVFALRLDE
jgi:predicted protein tyrosine phosphatase